MQTPEGLRLSQTIRQNAESFQRLCEGLDDETASLAPPGRWSPKQIVSHLCGPDGIGHMPMLQAIVREDTPRFDIQVENPFFSDKRSRMSLEELLSEFTEEYDRIADFAAGLSEEQLGRKAHIPMLRESPMGEYPTLAVWIEVLGDRHLGMHIDHMRQIMQSLGIVAGIGRPEIREVPEELRP
ncbi:MAG: DUF664 domain-containing protein [Desulfomonile tiedjei]|nr:DUF664 domain-containing protein [Desulfomonile tiedjei]